MAEIRLDTQAQATNSPVTDDIPVWNNDTLTWKNRYNMSEGIVLASGFELTDTVFDDLRIEPTARNTGPKAPSFEVWEGGLYLYSFDDAGAASEKELFFTVQLPHTWKEGSTLYPHVHWVNKGAGGVDEVVRWGLEYSRATAGGTFSVPTTIYTTDLVEGDITVENSHLISDFSDITMSGYSISSIFACRLFRNSSNAADTYDAETAGLLYIDWHYEINTLGSREEYLK